MPRYGNQNPRRCLTVAALSLVATLARPAEARAQEDCQPYTDFSVHDATVQLDGNGIADFRFLNPRSPFAFVRSPSGTVSPPTPDQHRECMNQGRVRFINETSGRTFNISIPFTLKTVLSVQADLLAATEEVEDALALAVAADQQAHEVRKLDEQLHERSREIRELDERVRQLEQQASADEVSTNRSAPAEPEEQAIAPERAGRPKLDYQPMIDDISAIKAEAGQVIPQDPDARNAYTEDLAKLIKDFLNPDGDAFAAAIDLGDDVTRALLEGKLAKLDRARRQLNRVARANALVDLQQDCGSPTRGLLSCTLRITLRDGQPVTLTYDQWQAIRSVTRDVIIFTVGFFDEAETPPNAVGYFAGVFEPKEPASASTWSFTASAGYSQDPEPDADPDMAELQKFTNADPYGGDALRRLRGAGRIDLKQTLGNRADADATLTFKTKDFGGTDSTGDVTVSQYKVNVYQLDGITTRFGKYSFASPSSKIAISESGEGIEVFVPSRAGVSIAYLVKRESEAGTPNAADLDSTVWIAQARNIALGGKYLKSLSLIGVRGKDEGLPYTAPREVSDEMPMIDEVLGKPPFEYETYGGEVRFGLVGGDDGIATKGGGATWSTSGSLAAYASTREVEELPAGEAVLGAPKDGNGDVWLLTLQWSQLKRGIKPKVLQSFALRLGMGSGDEAGTGDEDEDEDEGYLGENASFAPDTLFLAGVAGSLDAGASGAVQPGLSNKSYLGATYVSSDERLNPLRWLAGAVDLKEKPTSMASIARLHLYEFREPVFDEKDAGIEASLGFEIEVPKDVKTTLEIAKFWRGDALKPLIASNPILFRITTSLTLK